MDELEKSLFSGTCLCGFLVLLVPYEVHHVEKYHQWMLDQTLLSATASESLSLEQEYEMQVSWAMDLNKATMIILHKNDYLSKTKTPDDIINSCTNFNPDTEIECMAGDVNAFFLQLDSDEINLIITKMRDNAQKVPPMDIESIKSQSFMVAEMEIMIAEPKYRGLGLALESLCIMMHWIKRHITRIEWFIVKINKDNLTSIRLFQDRLGFIPYKQVEIFEEIHMYLPTYLVSERLYEVFSRNK
jgi:hypothetical protein